MWCKKKERPNTAKDFELPKLIDAKEANKKSAEIVSLRMDSFESQVAFCIDTAVRGGLFTYTFQHWFQGGQHEETAVREFLKGKVLAEYGYRVSVTKIVLKLDAAQYTTKLEITISWGKEDEQ